MTWLECAAVQAALQDLGDVLLLNCERWFRSQVIAFNTQLS